MTSEGDLMEAPARVLRRQASLVINPEPLGGSQTERPISLILPTNCLFPSSSTFPTNRK